MRKALTMIMFYQITLASGGRGMRAAFSSPSLSSWGKCTSTKSSSRLYNNYKGQMTMWGENLSSSTDDQRRIPIATPQQRRPISQDSEGRNIRRRGGNRSQPANDSWDDFDSGDNFYAPSKGRKDDSWDNYDDDRNYGRNNRSSNKRDSNNRSTSRRSNNNTYSRDGGYRRQDGRNSNNNNFRGGGRQAQQRRGSRFSDRNYDGRGGQSERFNRDGRYNNKSNEDPRNKIDLRALEGAGYVHLYGLAPILNALDAGKRDFSTPEESNNFNNWEDEDDDESFETVSAIKPEAKPAPYLFVQSSKSSTGGKVGSKALAASQVEKLASDLGIPIATVDKGVLNTLCQNRPHQGFILRCGSLDFETMSRIPFPSLEDSDDSLNSQNPHLWLVLDEIMDPQNFGALLRSAYFLGGETNKIGIMVCSKNSAPPSPVVSAASAGALELCQVYSTSNLPRTLNAAKSDGWRVLGAAAFAPNTNGNDDEPPVVCQDLSDVEPATKENPTILVLGSEGHGLRTLVAKACTGFVRIPGAISNGDSQQTENSSVGVDSLNVSVTGGIMLWNLVNGI